MYVDIFNQSQQIQHTLQCYANGDVSYKGNFVLVSFGIYIFTYLFIYIYLPFILRRCQAHIIEGLVPNGRMHNKA